VELGRTKQAGVVLWLPLHGTGQERLNGMPIGATPGMGLLFRPGDELLGRTSEELEGISLLVPESRLPGDGHSVLERGPRAREVIARALVLAEATAQGQPGLEHGAPALVEALQIWQQDLGEPQTLRRERPGAARARTLVKEAIRWMEDHLGEPFAVSDLATGLSSSGRALQYPFHQELGHPPLSEARRLRLCLLRARLLDPDQSRTPIGMLMAECGLLGGGSSAGLSPVLGGTAEANPTAVGRT
jgi:AraC-like DNA-binding protein